MSFTSPIGSLDERKSGEIWPGHWFDASGYDEFVSNSYHTGADLNLNYPHWDFDRHKNVYSIGEGIVTYAQIYSTKVWGALIIIDHGSVDGSPLFSRYAHVENIIVSEGQSLSTGEVIANVGNGEGLFPYHLHFDISITDILGKSPWQWPGQDRSSVHTHYANPQDWLQTNVSSEVGFVIPSTKVLYISSTLGLRVRIGPGLSHDQVDVLPNKTRVLIIETSPIEQDGYSWGQLRGGKNDGYWIALGKSDKTALFTSQDEP